MVSSSQLLGISGKELPPSRVISGQSLTRMWGSAPVKTSEMTTSGPDPNVNILRTLVEQIEQVNLCIRRLNDLRKQRRLVSCVLENISSDKEEDDIPDITAFMAASMHSNSFPSMQLLVSQPNLDNTEATGSNAVDIGSQIQSDGVSMAPNDNIYWHAAMASANQLEDLKLLKSDYVDYSCLGQVFRLAEASKKMHELEPSTIPNVLRQMVHYRIFTPLSMFTTNSMNMIHNNVGDLYMKKKTGSVAGKYVLNSDLFQARSH